MRPKEDPHETVKDVTLPAATVTPIESRFRNRERQQANSVSRNFEDYAHCGKIVKEDITT